MELNKYFNIHFERADDATIAKRLIGGAKIKGPALVTLILSIFIASIGLNMNSTAVVIGAMLISPLMGPRHTQPGDHVAAGAGTVPEPGVSELQQQRAHIPGAVTGSQAADTVLQR